MLMSILILKLRRRKTNHYPQLKKYRIITNENDRRVLEEINDPNSDAHSLTTFTEEVKFEKELLKKLNKQMETGIISYHNPRNDCKDVNNSWICNLKRNI